MVLNWGLAKVGCSVLLLPADHLIVLQNESHAAQRLRRPLQPTPDGRTFGLVDKTSPRDSRIQNRGGRSRVGATFENGFGL